MRTLRGIRMHHLLWARSCFAASVPRVGTTWPAEKKTTDLSGVHTTSDTIGNMIYRLSLLISAALLVAGCGKADELPQPAVVPDDTDVSVADTDVGPDDTDIDSDVSVPDAADAEPDADPSDTTGTADTDADDVESATPIADPPAEYSAVEHTVFVHVTDWSGSPLPGATIFLDASAAVSDGRGDAEFRNVGPGNYALSARNGGFVDGLWNIEIPHLSPLEIEIPHLIERRYFASLTPIAAATTFAGIDGASVASGPHLFDIGASTLTGPDGTESGTVEAELTLGSGTLSSGTAAMSTDGTPQTLDPIGSFDLTFLDEDGVPLQLAEGETVLAQLNVGRILEAGTVFPTYVLDQLTGIWHEEPGNEAVVDDDGLIDIEIPHLSRWAFGRPLPRDAGCVRLAVPGFQDYPDAVVRIDSESGSFALPVASEVVDVRRLIPGEEVTATLYLGAGRLQTRDFTAVEEADGDVRTCEEFAEAQPFELPAPLSDGDGSARVRLHLRSGSCPAQAVSLQIIRDAETYAAIEETPASTVVLNATPAGLYSVVASLGGGVVGEREFEVSCSDCELDFRVDLARGLSANVKGGCSELPCYGDECLSCVSLTVRDTVNSPVATSLVSAFEPVDSVLTTDETGALCVDVPAADNRLLFSAHRFDAVAAARLPRGASCGTGGCAEIALVASPRVDCIDGLLFDDALGVELGHFDPRYSNFRDFDSTPDRARSFFRAVVSGDTTGALASTLAGEPTILNGAVALNLVQQNRVGDEVIQGLSIRVVLPESGLGLDITLPRQAARGGTFDLAGGEAFARLATLPQGADDTSDYSLSTSGSAVVLGIGGGRVSVLIRAVFEDRDGETADISLIAIAPVLTEADSNQNLLAQRSHPMNGRAVRILTPDNPEGYVDTMTGTRSDSEYPAGEFDFCAPPTEFYMMRGEDIPGLVTPITSLYRDAFTDLALYENDAAGASSFVTADLRWFDRDFLALMYRGVGADPADIETSGTITGRFADRTGFLREAGRVTLEMGDTEVDAFLVGDDFTPATSTPLYFLPSIPPTTLDAPYTIRAFRTDGEEILEFRQRVVPMAGTALIPHP